MANYKQLWLPRLYPFDKYAQLDRPGDDTEMFYQYDNNYWSHEFTDSKTGKKVNFGTTLSGSDNKLKNLDHAWRKTSGYADLTGHCKNDNYISWHLGAIPSWHTDDVCINGKKHMLPGYIGLRFQYRWGSANHWSNAPVHINDMMLHYYDPGSGTLKSYEATMRACSETKESMQVNIFRDDDGRKNDTWKGAFYCPPDGSVRNEIRNKSQCMIGVSIEMKFNSRGGAQHTRQLQLRNLTPIWDRPGGAQYTPVLPKPAENLWTRDQAVRSNLELYLL